MNGYKIAVTLAVGVAVMLGVWNVVLVGRVNDIEARLDQIEEDATDMPFCPVPEDD